MALQGTKHFVQIDAVPNEQGKEKILMYVEPFLLCIELL